VLFKYRPTNNTRPYGQKHFAPVHSIRDLMCKNIVLERCNPKRTNEQNDSGILGQQHKSVCVHCV
jgi:hypothetical protein